MSNSDNDSGGCKANVIVYVWDEGKVLRIKVTQGEVGTVSASVSGLR